MSKWFLALGLLAIGTNYASAKCSYGGFLTCLNDTILNEWSELDSQGQGKLDSDKAKATKCLKKASCSASCEIKADFTAEIDDPNIKKLVQSIRAMWDSAPRTMQACILEKIRDNFFKELEERVQKKVSDFDIPDELGPLPMPPAKMYKDRHLLVQYVNDKIAALLCLQSCPKYEDKRTVVRCMKQEIDKPLGKCVSDKICSISDCKKNFKNTCDAVSQSIQDIVKDGSVKLSQFDDKDATSAKLLGELKICKQRVVDEERLAESDFWKPSQFLQIFKDFTHVKADGKVDKFKALLKDLFNSYFDGDSFCSSQDCS